MSTRKIMIHSFHIDRQDLNSSLYDGFDKFKTEPSVRRTHLFNGRYENIYLTAEHIPALADILNIIEKHARTVLRRDDIQSGYWFNHMPSGAVTTRHRHDDYDELLSGVYYIYTPENSGDLILYDGEPPTCITPITGQLIFFPPDLDHEVTANRSDRERLSIGINFGPIDRDDDEEH